MRNILPMDNFDIMSVHSTQMNIDFSLILVDIYNEQSIPITMYYMNNKTIKHCAYSCIDHEMNDPTSIFTWTISSKDKLSTEYMACVGYIRRITNKNIIKYENIIDLCIDYLTDKCQNIESIKDINTNTWIYSDVFILHSFKWHAMIHAKKNKIFFKLCLLASPPAVKVVKGRYLILLCETNEIFEGNGHTNGTDFLNHYWGYYVCNIKLKLYSNIEHLKKLTFKIRINELCVSVGKPNRYWPSKYEPNYQKVVNFNQSLKTISYYWKWIMNQKDITQLKSIGLICWGFDMCNGTWHIKIIDRQIYLIQLNTEAIKTQQFTILYEFMNVKGYIQKYFNSWYYPTNMKRLLANININELDGMTMYLKMTLIDCYHKNGDNLMHKYYGTQALTKCFTKLLCGSYEWSIPNINLSNANYICHGYIRKTVKLYIPIDIVNLCIFYLKNIENNIINKFKSKRETHILSNLFTIGPLSFCIEFKKYPANYHYNKFHYRFQLQFVAVPKQISHVFCRYRLIFRTFSLNKETSNKQKYSKDNNVYVREKVCVSNQFYPDEFDSGEIHGNDLTGMIFNLDLSVDIQNKNGESILNDEQFQSTPTHAIDGFEWHLNQTADGLCPILESEVFVAHHLKWKFILKPNWNSKTRIQLLMTSIPSDIESIWIKYDCFASFKQMETYCDVVRIHTNDNSRIVFNIIEKVYPKKIKVLITLLDIFDMNGCSIKDKYANVFKYWLTNDVELPIYYEILTQNGINMNNISSLTMGKLNKFGIKNMNHQIQILHQVANFMQIDHTLSTTTE
eukprot:41013_1